MLSKYIFALYGKALCNLADCNVILTIRRSIDLFVFEYVYGVRVH